MSSDLDASVDRLVADFRNVVASAESLLQATIGDTGDQAGAARQRIHDTLREAREQLDKAEAEIGARARAAIGTTDQLVRKHPWESVAVAAAVGVIAGILLGRR